MSDSAVRWCNHDAVTAPGISGDGGRVPPGWARFDDLRTGRALVFTRPRTVVQAWRLQDVGPALRAVETACADGAWAAGYVAYEAAPGLDPTLAVRPSEDHLPLVWFGVVDRPPLAVSALRGADGAGCTAGPWRFAWDADQHATAVQTVREHIAAGRTYQVNLTTRLQAPVDGDPLSLYAGLAWAQRGAYNAYLDLGDHVVASASPELFFSRQDDHVVMRPMKGTAARGKTRADDRDARAALLVDPKERAENVMIVDLVRNDLATVAETGSVRVTRLLTAERYPTVHQLTSQVEATLRPGTGLTELFAALFPCGSITGAPKRASMAVIRDLETSPRGVYCGAVGMLGPPGADLQARFSVAIRTAVVDRRRGVASYGVGGGITWSSTPRAEFSELVTKTKILDARTEFQRAGTRS